jgi:hypothetical protein
MISSASTLLLATLVFNAATVLGAPIRMATAEPVARAEISTPVQPVARAAIVDVQDNRRRSLLGRVSRRSARFVSERDVPFSEVVEVREPALEAVAPVVEARDRRYPRRVLHDFYKRDPATSVKETLTFNKVTVHDTPADAVAYNFGELPKHHDKHAKHHSSADAGAKKVASTPCTDAPNVSTTISVATTIPDASVPVVTPPAAAAPSANATPAPAATDATPAAATPVIQTLVPVAPEAAPTPASGSSPAPADPAASAPASPAAGAPDSGSVPAAAGADPAATTSAAAESTPTATPVAPAAVPDAAATPAPAAASPTTATDSAAPSATSTATSSAATDSTTPPADGTTAPSTDGTPASGGDATPVDGGASTPTSTAAATDATATDAAVASDAAAAPDATPDAGSASRRSVHRRTLAVSGASWASAVRRQLNV